MNEEQPDLTPMSSPANDVRKLRTNSAATAAEMMEWLQRMRGKSPREVLGSVASSHLFKSFVMAVFLVAFVVFGWTAAAWGWEMWRGDRTGNRGGHGGARRGRRPRKRRRSEVHRPTWPTRTPLKCRTSISTASRQVADKLGVGETKTAPANTNPLDSDDDDLLKGSRMSDGMSLSGVAEFAKNSDREVPVGTFGMFRYSPGTDSCGME